MQLVQQIHYSKYDLSWCVGFNGRGHCAGVETINLVMVDSDTTDHQNTVDLELDTAATTINVSGDAGLIITDTSAGSVDIDLVTTMDASGVVLSAATANGVTYTQAYNVVGGATNITGSNGVDSIYWWFKYR